MGNIADCKCGAKIYRESYMTDDEWYNEVDKFKESHTGYPCEVMY